MSFTSDLRRFERKTEDKMSRAARKITLDAFSSVIMMSPVGNPSLWSSPAPEGYLGGRFRGNWQAAIGSIPSETTEAVDPSGTQTIGSVRGVIAGAKPGDTIYLANNLPYGPALEDGWSRVQAPNGMVKLTVQRFQPIAEAVIRQIGRE